MSEDRGLPPRKAPVQASAGFWRVSQISIYWTGSEWKTLELFSDKREYLESSLLVEQEVLADGPRAGSWCQGQEDIGALCFLSQ